MNCREYLICVMILLCGFQVLPQCADRQMINERISGLKSSDIPFNEQKIALTGMLRNLDSCPVIVDTVKVFLLQRLGALSYLTSDFEEAVYFTNQSVRMLKDLKEDYTNVALLIRMYHFLGIFYDSLEMVNKKIAAIDSCIYYAEKAGAVNNEILYDIMVRLEHIYNIGDFQKCIIYSRYAENMAAKYGEGENKTLYDAVFFSYRINAMNDLKMFDSAYELVNERIEKYFKTGRENLCGPLYNLQAIILTGKEKYAEALMYLDRSFSSNRKNGYALGCKQSLNNTGYFYLRHMRDPVKAHKCFRQALQFHSDAPQEHNDDIAENSNVLGNIANVYVELKNYDSAFFYFNRAFEASGKGYNERSFLTVSLDEFVKNSKILYYIQLVSDKADAWQKHFTETKQIRSIDNAIAIYKVADSILTRIKENHEELQSKLEWRRMAKLVYEHAIEASVKINRTDDAFYFFERSRAVLMNDNLRKPGRAEPQKDFSKLNGTCLIEIFTGDSAVYVMYIINGGKQIKKIDQKLYKDLTTGFTSYLSDESRLNAQFEKFVDISVGLYSLLFDSIDITTTKIVVSPDELYYPFESLITGRKINGDPVYLLEKFAVSYTYSAYFLQHHFELGSSSDRIFMGVAPVRFSFSFLPSLEGSESSLESIARFFSNRKLLIHENATKQQFLQQFHQYDIVQLYTHASDGGFENSPVIYFSDSALRLSELSPNSSSNTRIIILTACETAQGKLHQGEGVFSFNRAFAEAGVPAATVNLWSVDNQSAYKLTELFCRYVSEGFPLDEALQRAKLEFISNSEKDKRLPFYWAAPVLAGQIVTIDKNDNSGWVVYLPLLIAAIAGFLWFKWRNHNSR